MVSGMGVPRNTLDEPCALSQVVAASICNEFQDSDAGSPWPTRLPAGCVPRLRTLHHVAAAESPFQNALFSRSRTLGAEAAEQPALVQDCEWLGERAHRA